MADLPMPPPSGEWIGLRDLLMDELADAGSFPVNRDDLYLPLAGSAPASPRVTVCLAATESFSDARRGDSKLEVLDFNLYVTGPATDSARCDELVSLTESLMEFFSPRDADGRRKEPRVVGGWCFFGAQLPELFDRVQLAAPARRWVGTLRVSAQRAR